MEPVRGGRLSDPPPRIQEIWDEAPVRRSPVEWALQWLWDQPEVSLVLSGMGTLEQVEQNASYEAASRTGSLGDEELGIVARVRDAYRELLVVDCTDCRYCLPCPNGVGIPGVLEALNDLYVYGDLEGQRDVYTWIEEEQRAERCTSCRECESRCPQGIPIAEWMGVARELLGPDAGGED
jgi:hypothetical protein